MKTLLLLILISLTCLAHSQIEPKESNLKGFWLSAKVYPGFSRDLFGSYSHEVNFDPSHLFTLSGDVEISTYVVTNKWSVSTGVMYREFGYKEKTWSNFIPNYMTRHTTRRSYYLSLPMGAQYHFHNFYAGLGLNLSYLVRDITIVDNQKTLVADSDKWLIGAQVKLGYRQNINSRLGLQYEANYVASELLRGSFPAFIWQNSQIGYYSFGLGLGVDVKI